MCVTGIAHNRPLAYDPIITNPKMPQEIKSCGEDAIDEFIDSIKNAKVNYATLTPHQSSTKRIPKVRGMVKKTDEYEKYYVPKVVSIGPYHYGKKELQSFQNLKPVIVEKIFEGKHETLRSLYKKLLEPQKVNDLRSFYDEDLMPVLSDTEFTNMMVLDSCFVLFYGESYFVVPEDFPELKGSQIILTLQDLFLLENQIPLKVLAEVASQVTEINFERWITLFIYESSIVTPLSKKALLLYLDNRPDFQACDHLLHALHLSLIQVIYNPKKRSRSRLDDKLNYRNVSELVDVGIHFKPSSRTSLANVEFSKGWLRFSASVELPRIKLNGSTKPMLLNLITYEMCSNEYDAWVTSYVCLLDSLIDNAEDVKILRKSWVLDPVGSDEEVAKWFNEIGKDLVSYNLAYSDTTYQIQKHYESGRNTLFWQLKNEYFKSPWAIFALLGALIALFLSAASTYYTRWSPKGECDDLCNFLKINHHL